MMINWRKWKTFVANLVWCHADHQESHTKRSGTEPNAPSGKLAQTAQSMACCNFSATLLTDTGYRFPPVDYLATFVQYQDYTVIISVPQEDNSNSTARNATLYNTQQDLT